VRRPDAAGREQIIVAGPQRVHRVCDPLDVVGHHSHLGEPNALLVEPQRDLRDVLVLRPAGQDLVTDHQQRGGPATRIGHPNSVGPELVEGLLYFAI
jgi:hypothetical protein